MASSNLWKRHRLFSCQIDGDAYAQYWITSITTNLFYNTLNACIEKRKFLFNSMNCNRLLFVHRGNVFANIQIIQRKIAHIYWICIQCGKNFQKLVESYLFGHMILLSGCFIEYLKSQWESEKQIAFTCCVIVICMWSFCKVHNTRDIVSI